MDPVCDTKTLENRVSDPLRFQMLIQHLTQIQNGGQWKLKCTHRLLKTSFNAFQKTTICFQ